jgi:hypothetical protein
MTEYETIEGPKIDIIFDQLMQDRTLIKVSMPEMAYENLTLLTDIQEDDKEKRFTIDPPKGLLDYLGQAQTDRLFFEFTGPDHLIHRFEAQPTALSKSALCLRFPQAIDRYQMRDNFRVKVLSGSYAELQIEDRTMRMEIDNLSLGGVFCICSKAFKSLLEGTPRLEDMELTIALKNDLFVANIERVLVKRIETLSRPKYFGIAFEFLKMHKEVRKRLVRHIYELQRDFLQTRLKMDI